MYIKQVIFFYLSLFVVLFFFFSASFSLWQSLLLKGDPFASSAILNCTLMNPALPATVLASHFRGNLLIHQIHSVSPANMKVTYVQQILMRSNMILFLPHLLLAFFDLDGMFIVMW